MTATRVSEGVFRITTPLPFRPRSVHAYLAELDGGGWLLVDGGLDSPEAWAALDAGVRAAAGGWESVALHLVTHMHVDHLGLARRVREASGAPLAMGELDAARAAHAAAHPEEEAGYRAGLVLSCGAPAELAGGQGGGAPGFVPADVALPSGTAPLPGAPGWLSVWTPGHTAGHVALLRESDRLLLAGDAVLPAVTPTLGVNRQRDDPVGDYLAALDTLLGLEPALAAGGHGEPIERPAARIAELRRATEEEAARVEALLDAAPATAWELVLRRYAGRALPPPVAMQALRETLAHLRRLAALGRARPVEREEGTVGFSRLPP